MELVDELVKKDEQEHGVIIFDDRYFDFYKLCLEQSGLSDAYIRKRAFNNEGLLLKGSKALHFVGEHYADSMKRFNDVRKVLNETAKKQALVLGYMVYGIDSQEFYTGMDYTGIHEIIRKHYINIAANKSLGDAERQKTIDKYKSRQLIRNMFVSEPVPYAIRRTLSDIAYIFEGCSEALDSNKDNFDRNKYIENYIENYIEEAEVQIEVYYQNVSFNDRVLKNLAKICRGIQSDEYNAHDIYYDESDGIRQICQILKQQMESNTMLVRQCLCMLYMRSMIDADSDSAKITISELTECFGGHDKLAAAVSGYHEEVRCFRNNAEWENYGIRVRYERYVKKHNIKTRGALHIEGYNEAIAEISDGNNRIVEYLWKCAGLPADRLMYRPYENGCLICYFEGIADRDKLLGFKDLLSESVLVTANWFRIQGYDPLFCRQGLGYSMYYQYGIHAGMTCDECEQAIARYLGEQEGDAEPDVKKYRSRIRRISSRYRYNHEKYADYEIIDSTNTRVQVSPKSADKLDILEAFAEQYSMPEFLRQADRINKPLLDLLNECVLRYKINPPKRKERGVSLNLSRILGRLRKRNTSEYNDYYSDNIAITDATTSSDNSDIEYGDNRIEADDNQDAQEKAEYYVPYCFLNKATGIYLTVCLLFNYNSLGRADIIFPVPVIFAKSKEDKVCLITDFEDYFTGSNAVANLREISFNQFLKQAHWLDNYILIQ